VKARKIRGVGRYRMLVGVCCRDAWWKGGAQVSEDGLEWDN
jgi:hypothetical protein